MIHKNPAPKLDYLFLIIGLGVLFLVGLGSRPLSSPDEGRYVEIPREMVVSGDYVTPHLNGLKYFEKPPFVYCLEAAPLKLGFTSEFAMRLPIAFFALLGCLVCYAFATRIFSRSAGLISAAVLATSTLYFALSRIILLDLVFSVLIAAGLFSFIVGIKLSPGKERRFHLLITAITTGLAVLTKGLIGIVFPLGIIGLWVILLNKWHICATLSPH
ncbi:MAG: phospholipid carrier-dependent glycosyltransferase [Holosporaceae bacterium]|nr:MAG: phospholipid carrier-dependent glycosyltransferase [Holosporaceae bacterium]